MKVKEALNRSVEMEKPDFMRQIIKPPGTATREDMNKSLDVC